VSLYPSQLAAAATKSVVIGTPTQRHSKVLTNLKTLLNTIPQQGKVIWIGVRPARRETMQVVNNVFASAEHGLDGDRYQGRTGDRQVTLLQAEHLPVIAACAGHAQIAPELLRRNILVQGINLLALRDKVITIGGVELAVTGLCHPCSRMEELLGAGGYNAMRGHGGVTARVLTSGPILIGDLVSLKPVSPEVNPKIQST
jgi:MOSC domain-containing protein YiiM